jgi:hypothetical protein
VGKAPIPRKLPNVLGIACPFAFSVGENVAELLPEATSRRPVLVPVVAGNWLRTEAGTVNVFCPAVVRQMNSVVLVTALVPVPVVVPELPMISTISDALPPVQLSVRGELRLTVVGKALDRVSGEARVSEVLNDPTSLPPAPLKL